MPRKKLPASVIEWFRREGLKGGSIGGKTAAKNMTALERQARARKAGEASGAARRARSKAKAGS